MEVGRRGRGRAIWRVANEGLHEEIRILCARLVAVEEGRHRDRKGGDDSEEEVVATTDGSNEEGPKIKLLRSVLVLVLYRFVNYVMVFCWTGGCFLQGFSRRFWSLWSPWVCLGLFVFVHEYLILPG